MVEYKKMTTEQLREQLIQSTELLRQKRWERQALEDDVLGISFACDDIRTEINSRRVPLRLVS